MKRLETFFTKISHFLLMSQGLKVLKCERERKTNVDWYKTDGGLLYWPFFNPRCISIFRAPLSTSSASRVGRPRSTSGNSLVAPSEWLSDVSARVYIISQHPLFPVVNARELLTSTHRCLPVYTAGTYCPRNPWLAALSKFNMQHHSSSSLTRCSIHTALFHI